MGWVREHLLRSGIGGRRSITLFGCSQASPVRPSDKVSVKVKTLYQRIIWKNNVSGFHSVIWINLKREGCMRGTL
jgi:hypothetical protein